MRPYNLILLYHRWASRTEFLISRASVLVRRFSVSHPVLIKDAAPQFVSLVSVFATRRQSRRPQRRPPKISATGEVERSRQSTANSRQLSEANSQIAACLCTLQKDVGQSSGGRDRDRTGDPCKPSRKTRNSFVGVAYMFFQQDSRSPSIPKLYRPVGGGVGEKVDHQARII
jgi:hypothetical protein